MRACKGLGSRDRPRRRHVTLSCGALADGERRACRAPGRRRRSGGRRPSPRSSGDDRLTFLDGTSVRAHQKAAGAAVHQLGKATAISWPAITRSLVVGSSSSKHHLHQASASSLRARSPRRSASTSLGTTSSCTGQKRHRSPRQWHVRRPIVAVRIDRVGAPRRKLRRRWTAAIGNRDPG